MDFYGMKRKKLQTLCKKHGIPANLKNVEMASRLASLFEMESEATVTKTNTQGPKRSVRLKARAANLSSKEERNSKQSKESPVVNSQKAESWKEIHQSKDDETCSLEKEIQAANLHGNFFEEEMEITKVGCLSVDHCVSLTPGKLLDEYAQLEPEEAGGASVEARGTSEEMKTVNQELVKDKPQEMAEDSPETNAKLDKVEGKDDEKSSLQKDMQAANLHGNFSEYTENSSAEEEIGAHMSVYTQFEPEEAGGPNVEAKSSSENMKSLNQDCVKEKPQGMVEDSLFTSQIKVTDSDMITENDLDFTLKSSVDISPRRNTQGLSSELVEGVLTGVMEENEEALSLPIEHSEVSNPEAELFVEITPPPALVQLAVHNPDAELSVLTSHILVKDIGSTVISKEEALISIPSSELEEHSFVAKLARAEAFLGNSSGCWNKIHTSKDDQKDSLEKKIQAENLHGNFSEYNSTANCKVGRISVDHCVNLETMDGSLENSEQIFSCERSCKLDAMELSRWSSTGFFSISPKENSTSKCFVEDEIKVLSQPLPRNKDAGAFDESAIFTTPERNLMLMEQLSEKGKMLVADAVTHHNDEAVESHAVVFTTPKQVLFLGDAGLYEAEKEEEHPATDFPDESDVLNTIEKLGGSRQIEASNEGESRVVEVHDASDIATSPERQFSVEDFKGDIIERNEDDRTVELHCESGTCTSPDRRTLLGSYESDTAENSGRDKAMELYEEPVVFTGLGSFGQDKARESEGKNIVQFYEESGVSTRLHSDQPLSDSELGEAGWQGINSADKSSLFTSLERQLLYGDLEQNKAVKTGEKAAAEFHGESVVLNIPKIHLFPEDSELGEAAKSKENKVVELRVDGNIFTSTEKHLLLETDDGVKGDNISAKSHVVSDASAAAERQSLMGGSVEAEKNYKGNKDVESNASTNLETHILFGNSELDEMATKIRDCTAATCEESFVFTSPERRQQLENSESYSAGKQEQMEVDDSVVQECYIAAPDFRENTIANSCRSIASKVSHCHEFNAGLETAGAELMPKASQTEDVVALDASQGTVKKNSKQSLQVDSYSIMEPKSNVSFSSYAFALSAEDISETKGEISSHFELAGTCSMVSEVYSSSTDIKMQIDDALKELAITDHNDADEHMEDKVTKNIQKGYEGNLMLNTSCGSSVSGKMCVLAETEDEHLSSNSEVDLRNTWVESGRKILEDEATGRPTATAFEKAISLTPDECTAQNRTNEKDKEMITTGTTPSHEETLNESSENKQCSIQVRREPIFIYRTQVKPQRHDMKENAINSKIVDNLNVTAPRTSKRQPLQDLSKN